MINRVTKKIFIGEASDAVNREELGNLKIDAILSLEEHLHEEGEELARELGIFYFYCPIYEGTENMEGMRDKLKEASFILEELSNSRGRILVNCESGIDRAPFVVATYIARVADLCLFQAYDIIKRQRKCIMEHYEWECIEGPLSKERI